MAGILFDARWVRPGMTGVGYFAYNLLRAAAIPRERCGVILCAGSPFRGDFAGFRIFETRIDLVHHPLTDLYEQAVVPWLCLRHGYGAFLSFEGRTPAFHPGFATYPMVYDLSILKLKGSHTFKYRFFLRAHLLVSRLFATRIVTISETVKSEMIRVLGLPPSRVLVAYPADSALHRQAALPPAVPDRPFFLAVGITNRRKNLGLLVEALSRTGRAGERPLLVATGNPDLIAEAGRRFPEVEISNLGFVREGELRWLYEHALALVYPSHDEGFGIPLVDAAVFGCPVLCSDIPVFREVMGDAADFFDPGSPESLASLLAEAWRAGRHGGPERAAAVVRRFSWEETARRLMEELGIHRPAVPG